MGLYLHILITVALFVGGVYIGVRYNTRLRNIESVAKNVANEAKKI